MIIFTGLVVLLLLILWYVYRYVLYLQEENRVKAEALARIEDFSRIEHTIPLKNKIPNVCADKHIYMIDYENIGTIPKAISEDMAAIVFVFIGKTQKQSEFNKRQLIDTSNNFYFINMDKTMHNYLDIFMSCYVGAMISTYTPKSIRILSRDKGFSAVINATRAMGFMDIDYLVLESKLKFEKNFVMKNLKDILVLSSSSTVKMKQFKAILRKKYPQWTIDQMNLFIDTAKELKLIKVREINKITYVDISV